MVLLRLWASGSHHRFSIHTGSRHSMLMAHLSPLWCAHNHVGLFSLVFKGFLWHSACSSLKTGATRHMGDLPTWRQFPISGGWLSADNCPSLLFPRGSHLRWPHGSSQKAPSRMHPPIHGGNLLFDVSLSFFSSCFVFSSSPHLCFLGPHLRSTSSTKTFSQNLLVGASKPTHYFASFFR